MFSIPETAVRAFMRTTNLHVTVHDQSNFLWKYLPSCNMIHDCKACRAVKQAGHNERCIQHDGEELRDLLRQTPEGQYHLCHAGYVEWAVPIFRNGRIAHVIFAGQRRPGNTLRELPPPKMGLTYPQPWNGSLPVVQREQAEDILEILRQLAARLQEWSEQATQTNPADLDRADRIRVFMRDRHTEQPRLEDLAAVLHLSESRAGHLVRELTGRGFGALLTEARLQTATALLRNTALSIGQVALQSGFGDLGHFHRLFRRRMGQTPRGYRRLSEHGRQKS